MSRPLVANELIDQARKTTGLERFDSESFREGLNIYLADANQAARPEEMWVRERALVLKSLVTRLQTTDYLARHPELRTRPIERPVFVFGIPRTGTTLLNNLLAADPARRSPLSWEIDTPIPPPTTATLKTDPRAVARLEAERQMLSANPAIGRMYRFSAIYPNECMFMTIHDFKGLLWEGRGKLPNYRAWLFATDVTSKYLYHQQFLQILQHHAPGTWNLKMPSHGLWLETVKKIYPDARLVWTHRDPLTATSSFCSLMRTSHNSSIGAPDFAWLGENYPWQALQHANRIMDYRERHGESCMIDVHYADLMRKPIETMRTLYQALGDEFTPAAEVAMRAWLAAEPQGKFGKHEYRLAEFGLDQQRLNKQFERYLSRYEIEKEG
jgi:hypothetical protein